VDLVFGMAVIGRDGDEAGTLDRVLDVVLYYAPLFQPAEAVAVHLVGGTPPDLALVADSAEGGEEFVEGLRRAVG